MAVPAERTLFPVFPFFKKMFFAACVGGVMVFPGVRRLPGQRVLAQLGFCCLYLFLPAFSPREGTGPGM